MPNGIVNVIGTGTTVQSSWLTLLIIGGYLLVCGEFALVLRKANSPWWGAFIPFFNVYLLTSIAERPWWWLLGMFVPIVGIGFEIDVAYRISIRFSHKAPFAIGILILPPAFLGWLAFGPDVYAGAKAPSSHRDANRIKAEWD